MAVGSKLEWHNYVNIEAKLITVHTMWTANHFPAAMRSLTPSVRAKAIEIANALLMQDGFNKQEIITISVSEARVWSRRQSLEMQGLNVHRSTLDGMGTHYLSAS